MKTNFFILILALALGKLTAQRNPAIPTTTDNVGQPVPIAINNKFNSDYPNMHAAWSISGQNYRADYTDGSLDRSITYDRNGAIISREEELAKDNYPVAIRSYFARHYPNEQCEVWSKMDSAGNRNYYVSRTTETVWFDRNGKYRHTMKAGAAPKLQSEDH